MKTNACTRAISMLIALIMVVLSVPFTAFHVAADENTAGILTNFKQRDRLGDGINFLAGLPLRQSMAPQEVFLTDGDMGDLFVATENFSNGKNYLFTHVTDASKFLNNNTNAGSIGIGVKAQMYMVTLEMQSKFGFEETSAYEQNTNMEYAQLSVINKYKNKALNVDGDRINRFWTQDESGNYLALNKEFVYDIENISLLGKTLDEAYATFFANYGTHILTRYNSGAEAYLTYSGDNLSEKTTIGSSWNSNVTVEGNIQDFLKMSTELEKKGSDSSEYYDTIDGVSISGVCYGSDGLISPTDFIKMIRGEENNVSKWVSNVNDENDVVLFDDNLSGQTDDLRMMPIWALLVKPEHQALRVELERYFNTHVNAQYADLYESYIYNPTLSEKDYSDYTLITSAEEFEQIKNDLNGTYVLCCDIDLGGKEWTPIGTAEAPFTGVLDGNGATISGLSVTDTKDGAAGLFGYNEGTISDLNVVGTINVTETDSEKNAAYVGGIVGHNAGTISNCQNNVTVVSSLSAATGAIGAEEEKHLSDVVDFSTNIEDVIAKYGEDFVLDIDLGNCDTSYDLDDYIVVRLHGFSSKACLLKWEETSAIPLYIELCDANYKGSINSSATRDVVIVSKSESNSVSAGTDTSAINLPNASITTQDFVVGSNVESNSINADTDTFAINLPNANVYIVGDKDLTVTGGNGSDASGSKSDKSGNQGNAGTAAVHASTLTIDGSNITFRGGNGGTGSNGANGTNSTQTGGTGGPGGTGGQGGDGGLPIAKTTLVTVYRGKVLFVYGNGGTGGQGGKGGQGGTGSTGKDAYKGGFLGAGYYYGDNGGPGGQGGKGGTGGDGGNPASFADLHLTVVGDAQAVRIPGKMGAGGTGGQGGTGGTGGTGGSCDGVKSGSGCGNDCTCGGNGGNGGTGGTGGTGGNGSVGGAAGARGTGGSAGTHSTSLKNCWCRRNGYSGSSGDFGTRGNALTVKDQTTLQTNEKKYTVYNESITYENAKLQKGGLIDNSVFATGSQNGAISPYWGNKSSLNVVKGDNPASDEYNYILKVTSAYGEHSVHHGGYSHIQFGDFGDTYYVSFLAKIPVGYRIELQNNHLGEGGYSKILSSDQGTGEWQWYHGLWHYGTSGDIKDCGYIAIDGGGLKEGETVDWYLAYTNMYRNFNPVVTSLISINTEEEQQIANELLSLTKQQYAWIGLERVPGKPNWWQWADGTLMYVPSKTECLESMGKYVYGKAYDEDGNEMFSNWSEGEPNSESENVGQIYGPSSGFTLGSWNDDESTNTIGGYITETKIGVAPAIDPSCNGVYAGGIVGYNAFGGVVEKCINNADVTVDEAVSTDGAINALAAGIAGVNCGSVTNGYSTGNITAYAKSASKTAWAQAYAKQIANNLLDGTLSGDYSDAVCDALATTVSDLDNDKNGIGIDVAGTTVSDEVQASIDYWARHEIGLTFNFPAEGDEDMRRPVEYVVDEELRKQTLNVTVDGKTLVNYNTFYSFLKPGTRVVTISFENGGRSYERSFPVRVLDEKLPCKHDGNTLNMPAVAPDCDEIGYTEGVFCLLCFAYISGHEEVPATGAHVDADGDWETNENEHYHVCVCGAEFDFVPHSTTTANCVTNAVCDACGVEYGGVDSSIHAHTEIRDAVAPTCAEDGYTGDTYCADCGVLLETGKPIPATGDHVDADGVWESNGKNHYHTCACGARFDTETHYGGKATCSEKAYCEVCDMDYGSLDFANHANVVTKGASEPTCTEDGYTGDEVCADCGEVITKGSAISMLGHTTETKRVEPTCTEDGYVSTVCTVCGAEVDREILPAIGHDYKETVKDSTCTEDGVKIFVCANCGDTYTEIIPAKGHTEETTTVDATCTEDGYISTVCTVCGVELKCEVIPAVGHDYKETVVDSTCTEEGTKTFTCANCGDTYTESIPLKEHVLSDAVVTLEPTCTEEGQQKYTCANCGYEKTEPIPAKGHTEETVTVDATCTEDGYVLTVCTVCETELNREVIPATGHTEQTITFDATCTADGYVSTVCLICREELNREILSAKGHDYAETVVDSTCTEEGTKTFTCVSCGDTYTETIPLKEHVLSDAVVTLEPTCTEEGQQKYTCANCGYEKTESIPAKGHTEETETVDATCTEDGYVLTVCTVCETELDREVIPAKGHTEEDGVCTVCGETLFIYGDVSGDGKINATDVTRLLRYIANRDPFTGESSVEIEAGADVNGDGKINSKDVTRLLRYIANRDPFTGESSVTLGPSK